MTSAAASNVPRRQVVCTIIANNYLALARTLVNSLKAVNPQTECYVLVIDCHEHRFDGDAENFTLIRPTSLALESLTAFAFKYGVTEFATAMKPFLLQHLIEREGATHV